MVGLRTKFSRRIVALPEEDTEEHALGMELLTTWLCPRYRANTKSVCVWDFLFGGMLLGRMACSLTALALRCMRQSKGAQ